MGCIGTPNTKEIHLSNNEALKNNSIQNENKIRPNNNKNNRLQIKNDLRNKETNEKENVKLKKEIEDKIDHNQRKNNEFQNEVSKIRNKIESKKNLIQDEINKRPNNIENKNIQVQNEINKRPNNIENKNAQVQNEINKRPNINENKDNQVHNEINKRPNIDENKDNKFESANFQIEKEIQNEKKNNIIKEEKDIKNENKYNPFGNNPLVNKVKYDSKHKYFNYLTSKVLFLKDGKAMFCDSYGYFYFFNDINFDNPYIIKIFDSYPQDMLELNDGSIVSCSNDKSMKIFKIGNNNHEIILEYNAKDQLWAIAKLPEKEVLIIGDTSGCLHFFNKTQNGYEPGNKKVIQKATILNLFPISNNILMIILMSYGAFFLDLSNDKIVGKVEHQYFVPFKNSIVKISDKELFIGAEYSIILIDYINYKKLKHFKNDFSYFLYKFSEKYLLSNLKEGSIATYEMIRDEYGDLSLKFVGSFQFDSSRIIGITFSPDEKKFISYSLDNSILIRDIIC